MSTAVQIANGFFAEATHEYKNSKGLVVPSTTQILEGVGLTDLGSVPEDTLEAKRKLGDAVHYATAIMDRNRFFGGPELDWDTVHEKTAPYIMAWDKFVDQTGFVPEEVEQSGIHALNGMEYGYTRDRVGRIPGIKYRVCLELKCAYKEEKAWKYQLSAYEMTIPLKGNNEYIARFAVQLKPDASFKSYPYENSRDKDVFMWALALTHTKINDGLPWRKD